MSNPKKAANLKKFKFEKFPGFKRKIHYGDQFHRVELVITDEKFDHPLLETTGNTLKVFSIIKTRKSRGAFKINDIVKDARTGVVFTVKPGDKFKFLGYMKMIVSSYSHSGIGEDVLSSTDVTDVENVEN